MHDATDDAGSDRPMVGLGFMDPYETLGVRRAAEHGAVERLHVRLRRPGVAEVDPGGDLPCQHVHSSGGFRGAGLRGALGDYLPDEVVAGSQALEEVGAAVVGPRLESSAKRLAQASRVIEVTGSSSQSAKRACRSARTALGSAS